MKELEGPLPEIKTTAKTEIVKQMQKEYSLVGNINKRPGLTLFEVNLDTFEAEPVKVISKAEISIEGKPKITNKAFYNPNALYIWALNKVNALRKVRVRYEKFLISGKYADVQPK